jgi:hypothetical protein
MASHRRAYGFANALRTIANLEYHDFMRFEGEVYRTQIDAFLRELNLNHENFYNRLNNREKKSFAVCVADILKNQHLIVSSGCSGGLPGFLLCFNAQSNWSNRLKIHVFEAQISALANLAVSTWQAERNPLARWIYDDPAAKEKSTSCCCPRSSAYLPLPIETDLEAVQSMAQEEPEESKQQDQPLGPIQRSASGASFPGQQFFQPGQSDRSVSSDSQASNLPSPVPRLFQVDQSDQPADPASQISPHSPHFFHSSAARRQVQQQNPNRQPPRQSGNPLRQPLLSSVNGSSG